MKDVKVHAKDILRMIPDEELAKLSSSTKVDYCAKVLSGERMFYLLVFALMCRLICNLPELSIRIFLIRLLPISDL